MKIKVKFWFLKNYWWLLTILFITMVTIVVTVQAEFDFRLILTLVGTFLSIMYFLQKQRLEETRLFREIFFECNKRYDELNDVLNAIVSGPDEEQLSTDER